MRPPPWPSSQLSEAPLDFSKVEQSTSDLGARQANHLTRPEYSVAYNYKDQGARSTEIDPAPDNSAGILVDEVTRSLLQDEKRAEGTDFKVLLSILRDITNLFFQISWNASGCLPVETRDLFVMGGFASQTDPPTSLVLLTNLTARVPFTTTPKIR